MGASITLAGKVALVTGGSRGIGEAIARTFADHGARVVVAARKLDGAQAVADSICKAHGDGRAWAVMAHVGHEDQCVRLVAQAIEHFGKVDVLVNNAGTNPHFGPMLSAESAAWDKTFDVNLKGHFWCAREMARACIDRRTPGSIVNIASIAA